MTTTFKTLTPNLMVRDVPASIRFYTENLGFALIMCVSDTKKTFFDEVPADTTIYFAMLKRDDVQIMLQLEKSLKEDVPGFENIKIGSSVSLYAHVKNLEDFYSSVKDKVEIVKDLHKTWYGVNEFYIRDDNGYILGFAEEAKSEE